MNYDVYLGGLSQKEWRTRVKEEVSSDITIFDPMSEDGAHNLDNQSAKQLYFIENGNTLVVFYLNEDWNGTTSLLELGDAVGRGKQVLVCLDGKVRDDEKIRRYCEFRGVLIVESLDELVVAIETYLSELSEITV